MEELTELEWQILDSLADDWECAATMEIKESSLQEVRETIYHLYRRGLIEATPEQVQLETLMNESSDYKNAHYWFGLTSSGVEYWEEGANKYSDGPTDWAQAYTGYISYEHKEGYIDSTSEELCIDEFKKQRLDEGWQVDMNTLTHSKIEGFQAKYYKYIQGGHRISFKLNKKVKSR